MYVDAKVVEKWPDAALWRVVGHCMEPFAFEGDHALVSPSEPLEPGRVVVAHVGKDLPRIGIVEKVVGGSVVGTDNLGGSWRSSVDDVLGVVVHVVRPA